MALDFSGNTAAKVNHGSDASLDNWTVGTYMMWIFVTGSGDDDIALLEKLATGKELNFNPAFTLTVTANRATTALSARADIANFSSYAQNTWMFIAGTFNTGGADGDQRLLIGDLSTFATEPSSYSMQTVGSGTLTVDAAADLIVGNKAGDSRNLPGSIASVHIVNANLTNAQILAQQFRFSLFSDSQVYSHYGFNGTGTQADYSGNGNSGIVTSATVADHVPLGPPFGFDEPVLYTVAAPTANPKGPLGHPLHGALAGPISF